MFFPELTFLKASAQRTEEPAVSPTAGSIFYQPKVGFFIA
jgi:hypothetical protein